MVRPQIWPAAATDFRKLLDDVKEGSASGEIDKVVQAAPGWFKHDWGKLTYGKEMVSFVDTATFDGKLYYVAVGYVNEFAKYKAPKTDGAYHKSICVRNPEALSLGW